MVISDRMTVIAMTNGMIGGIILVMPILALETGYLLILPMTLMQGFFSYYSCLLCLKHLRNHRDLDESILHHFENRIGYKIFYDLLIASSLTILLILYFDLICEQWEGMTAGSIWIAVANALLLPLLVYVMKTFDFGASLLGYGILSIIGKNSYICRVLHLPHLALGLRSIRPESSRSGQSRLR